MILKKLDYTFVDQINYIEQQCFSVNRSKSLLESQTQNEHYVFIGAFLDNTQEEMVGFVDINIIDDEGYISNIGVLEQHRNKGVAKLLINEIIELSKEKNLRFVTLEVRVSNLVAISIYKQFGFEEVGVRRDFYYRPTEDALILTRKFKETLWKYLVLNLLAMIPQ